MRNFLCIQCSMEFPTQAAFQAHKDSGHALQGTSLVSPGDPGISPELMAQITRIEGKKDEPVKIEPEKEIITSKEMPPAEPIHLIYQYVGQCPDCRAQIKTIEIDVPIDDKTKKHFVIALCKGCDKQLIEREEKKL